MNQVTDRPATPRPTNNVRIESTRPLVPPCEVRAESPVGEQTAALVASSRQTVEDLLADRDRRLLVICGPCSIHDPEAGIEYARRLAAVQREFARELFIIMRVYFEKPRTRVGWKGLINDPLLDKSFDVNAGIHIARKLLGDIGALGVPTATEFLDPVTPQYTAELVSWGCIGARTTESQVHREMASGLSCPIGFKNTTSGSHSEAIDSIVAAGEPHIFLSVDDNGHSAVLTSKGNSACHVVLRGGKSGPNYDAASIAAVVEGLQQAQLPQKVIVDASHSNSSKDASRQSLVLGDLCGQMEQGQMALMGVMIESFLVEGRQDLSAAPLTFGQSITDACIGWEQTLDVLGRLARSSAHRMEQG